MQAAADSRTEQVSVAVVGAGPYGLALAYALIRRGASPLVLGRPMETWSSHMPRGMFLKSEGKASSIIASDDSVTLARYCAESGLEYADVGMPVPLETFVSYGRWFKRKVLPEVREVEVTEIWQDSGGFELALANGRRVHAKRVAIATGV